MWYKIDLTKFVVQLLPPILRSKFLVALLKVLVLPLSFVYDKLMGHRENVFDKLETSANVIYLEKVLNETFFLSDRQIYITSLEEDFSNYWHFKSENAPSKFLDNSSPTMQLVINCTPRAAIFSTSAQCDHRISCG